MSEGGGGGGVAVERAMDEITKRLRLRERGGAPTQQIRLMNWYVRR